MDLEEEWKEMEVRLKEVMRETEEVMRKRLRRRKREKRGMVG